MTLRLRFSEALRITFALVWRQIAWSAVALLPALVLLWRVFRHSPTSSELMARALFVAGPFLFLIGSIPAVCGAIRTRYRPFTLEVHRSIKPNADLIEDEAERLQQQTVVLMGGLALAFVVVFGAVLTVKLHDLKAIREAEPGRQYFDYDRDVNRKALAISTAASMQSAVLVSPIFPDAPVRAYWTREGKLLLMGQALAYPGPGREFQLWAEPRKGHAISLGMLRLEIKGELLYVTDLPVKPGDVKTLFITDERWGGQSLPSTPPIWSAGIESAVNRAAAGRTATAPGHSAIRGTSD
jgi:hypothetical protein